SLLGGVLFGRAERTSWLDFFRQRFAIVGSDLFTYLAETGTEVVARIRMDPKKHTVDSGGLWYEENLPAETVLSGLVLCERVYDSGRDVLSGSAEGDANAREHGERPRVEPADLVQTFCSGELRVQVGGKATVGRGLARLVFGGPQLREAGGE
ncbi:MAG: hypothetical protein K6U08_04270, partial [Firmicutes bacterium]|nr:hypothetical protein [Bacillota bacterium]